eukprot:m.123621 g.123621  ORF g.123621 m.123621 type:complete len:147 (+) comp29002_c0_seq1:364-804(+)
MAEWNPFDASVSVEASATPLAKSIKKKTKKNKSSQPKAANPFEDLSDVKFENLITEGIKEATLSPVKGRRESMTAAQALQRIEELESRNRDLLAETQRRSGQIEATKGKVTRMSKGLELTEETEKLEHSLSVTEDTFRRMSKITIS